MTLFKNSRIRILLFYLFLSSPVLRLSAQQEVQGLVNWLSFKEAQEKNKLLERPFLIDLYTDWCGWCKHMMRTTYSNPGIAAYINTNFYPVKFNAEGKDTVEYNGKIYKPTSPSPRTPHELALQFLGNSLSYPSTVFVTNKFQFSLLTQGYLEDKKIEPLLIYMVENAWRNVNYDQFNQHFLHTFHDTLYHKGQLKRYKTEELEAIQKKKPKKVLVLLNSGFCNTGKVMSKTSFTDTSLVSYINRNFYFTEFEVTRSDTILFRNEKHYPVLLNNFPIHSLALRFSSNSFGMPTLCILDEELNTLQVLNFYQSPENLKPILRYFGSNAFKKSSYTDFIKEGDKNSKKP